jgi:hypothetical protein
VPEEEQDIILELLLFPKIQPNDQTVSSQFTIATRRPGITVIRQTGFYRPGSG